MNLYPRPILVRTPLNSIEREHWNPRDREDGVAKGVGAFGCTKRRRRVAEK